MAIDAKKVYSVKRFSTGRATKRYPDADFGNLSGSEVKTILRGYTYDADMDMWFSKSRLIGYAITEIH